VKFVRQASVTAVQRILRELGQQAPTYDETGHTLTEEFPKGYRIDRHQADLGSGRETFDRAVRGLKSWEAHRVPGAHVLPAGTEIRAGSTVIVCLGPGLLALAAPCRVIAVVDEPSRWGFAYGSLPGHPEQGEEAFVVTLETNETVSFVITAFSRPADALVRLSGPIARAVQLRATRGYLRALQRFVGRPGTE